LLHHSYHSHDGEPWLLISLADALANRISLWPEAVRHFLIDQHYRLRFVRIRVRKEPACHQWYLHGSEIIRRRRPLIHLQLRRILRRHVPLDLHAAPPDRRRHWKHRHGPKPGDARQAAHSVTKFVVELNP